jgi:hypothetical protein
MNHPETLLQLAETTRYDRFAAAERHRTVAALRRAARRAAGPELRRPDSLMCPEPRRA